METKGSLRPLKKWGQHFLTDPYFLELIANCGELSSADRVLEIGPGDGRLTELLLASGASVTGVEIDARLVRHLKERFKKEQNFHLIEKDFLRLSPPELKTIFAGKEKVKVIANLPYYVTTPILLDLMSYLESISFLVIMVQREVGERFTATVSSRKAGAITLYLQYYTTLEIINTVPAAAFRPRPKVDSVILRIQPRPEPPVKVRDEKLFWQMIRAGFAQRRKTLINALLNAGKDERLKRSALEAGIKHLGLSLKIRGEKMTFEEFASLCNYLVT